jgi:hypothetical protein
MKEVRYKDKVTSGKQWKPWPPSPPRCVYRLVDKRVWDTSGSPGGTLDQRLRRPQGVVL